MSTKTSFPRVNKVVGWRRGAPKWCSLTAHPPRCYNKNGGCLQKIVVSACGRAWPAGGRPHHVAAGTFTEIYMLYMGGVTRERFSLRYISIMRGR